MGQLSRHEPAKPVQGEGVGMLALLPVAVEVRVLLTDGVEEMDHLTHQQQTVRRERGRGGGGTHTL